MTFRSRLRLFVVALLPLCAAASLQASDPPNPYQMDKKALDAKEKALVAEGRALEKKGRLDDAMDKFVDAEGFLSSKDALNGIERIQNNREKQVQALLAGAHKSYDAGKYSDCAEKLEKGLAISAVNPALHYDLALCYEKLEDRLQAREHLDSAIVATRDKKLRAELIQLRGNLQLGVTPVAAAGDARKRIDAFNATYQQTDSDAVGSAGGAGGAGGDPRGPVSASVCDQIKGLQAVSPRNPAILFNAAKCAEGEGRAGDSARLLGEYLRLAPQALDAGDAQAQQEDLTSLAALEGDRGAQLRSHFAAAALDLDYRRYDRALAEYLAAEQVWPEYPLTSWKLAMLYEGTGDVTQARKYFERCQQLKTDSARNLAAAAHLASLDQWRSQYDDNLEEAHDLVGDLLLRSMGLSSQGVKRHTKLTKAQKNTRKWYRGAAAASETLSAPYVSRQLDLAREALGEAAQLFPLGPEANELLALTDLENNNWPSAYNHFDAVASAGLPVSFYAQVTSSKDKKVVRAAKVEIGKESVRLVYLSAYNVSKKMSEPPKEPAGDDDLGNLVTSTALPPDLRIEGLSIPEADLRGVKTEASVVTVKRQKDELMIVPVFMSAYTPVAGKAARQFGNEYTRMFVRYLGYEKARLGKEGMTFGERLQLGFSFVDFGFSIVGAIAYGGLGAYDAFAALHRVSQTLKVDTKTLQRTTSEQRRTLEGLAFKPIPTQVVQLAFRDSL
jgi:tetratricopeptide (TPR) repeat protein